MLIRATFEDIIEYGDFVYRLAIDPTKSCYPSYSDGIKTRSDFFASAEQAVTKDTSELLLFFIDGIIEGWLSFYWIPEEKYLQLNAFNIDYGAEQALDELIGMLETKFTGYTAYFGFPGDNLAAINFLAEHDFKCIEQDWNHSFFFEGYTARGCSSRVEKISRDNFDRFQMIYRAGPETFWNADRILETLEDWTIFVYGRATPLAAIFFRGNGGYYEIYGSVFADDVFREDVFRDLLKAALDECYRLGANYLTYFCGDDEKLILHESGFRCVGRYVLYIRTI